MTHDHNLIDLASDAIEQAVSVAAMGEDAWWTLTPSLIPTPDGPRAAYLLMIHIRSSILGSGPMTNIAMFDNPLDLLQADKVGDHIAKMLEGLRKNRSDLLAQQ